MREKKEKIEREKREKREKSKREKKEKKKDPSCVRVGRLAFDLSSSTFPPLQLLLSNRKNEVRAFRSLTVT